jgi:hypothetical protein
VGRGGEGASDKFIWLRIERQASYECSNKALCFIKGREFLDWLSS